MDALYTKRAVQVTLYGLFHKGRCLKTNWPFTKLTIFRDRIEMRLFPFGKYAVKKDDVRSIAILYKGSSFIAAHVRISYFAEHSTSAQIWIFHIEKMLDILDKAGYNFKERLDSKELNP